MGKMKELAMDKTVEPQRIYYFNDTKESVSVFLDGLGKDNFAKTLKPNELSSFIVNIPNGCSPLVKVWDGYVMITYIPDNDLEW